MYAVTILITKPEFGRILANLRLVFNKVIQLPSQRLSAFRSTPKGKGYSRFAPEDFFINWRVQSGFIHLFLKYSTETIGLR